MKAAKKKKKKLLNKHKDNNKGGVGVNIHSSSTTIHQQGEVDLTNQEIDDGYVNNSCNRKLIQEESDFTNIGLVLESKSMEGSGNNGVEISQTEPTIKDDVVESVGEVESVDDSVSRAASIEVFEEIAKEELGNGDSLVDDAEKLLGSSSSHEEAKLIENHEPLKEEELEKSTESLKEEKSVVEEVPAVDTVEDIDSSISEVVTDDFVKNVASVSEELPSVLKNIVIVEELKNLETNESLQKETENKIAEKTEASDVPVSKENEDKVVAPSLDAPSVETEVAEQSGITERSQDESQDNLLIVPPMVQKANWKSCCGLFEAVSSSDR
ncbi:hypothetical protein FRX31_002843 [Thalictrum thalictroides]|uniref:Uncharacterized protein n=1 Tax=Thalictrum thalictroides TaxID=46969 RepID=A0A7J6XDL5_THATH|nr:hypothetical protein FRX31_002843 [Thalictrum thalictroides]